MGGGNGQKSATKRARAMEKAQKAPAGSQLKVNQQSMTIKCKICLQDFVCTTTEKVLREHQENRHPKQTFADAFPNFGSSS